MEKITSKNNNLIKKAAKLSASSSFRRKCGEFVLEGVRLCFDAVNSDISVCDLLVTERCLEKNGDKINLIAEKSGNTFIISEEIAERLADTVTTQGIFCICRFREPLKEIEKGKKYIALENIQDPSNLGAISRTAEALGIDGVLLSSGADIYSPKSMRASMGSLLRINFMCCESMEETILECNRKGMLTMACVPSSQAEKITNVVAPSGCVAVIGNEGNGVTDATIKACEKSVTIPMAGRAESLNAAVASSIVMWEMMRGGCNG